MRKSPFASLGLAVALLIAVVWTLLPLYWVLKFAFETSGELALFPPPLVPPHPQPGAFFSTFGFPYKLASGTTLLPSGQSQAP